MENFFSILHIPASTGCQKSGSFYIPYETIPSHFETSSWKCKTVCSSTLLQNNILPCLSSIAGVKVFFARSTQSLVSIHALCCQYTSTDLWQQLMSSYEILLPFLWKTMATLKLYVMIAVVCPSCTRTGNPTFMTFLRFHRNIFFVCCGTINRIRSRCLIYVHPFAWRKSTSLRIIIPDTI